MWVLKHADKTKETMCRHGLSGTERASMADLEATNATIECPTILQIGAEACAHCPQTTVCISRLTPDFTFTWIYANVLSELAEEFAVAKLPAVVVYKGADIEPILYQQIRGDGAKAIIAAHCPMKLNEVDF